MPLTPLRPDVMDAIVEAGVNLGLPRPQATEIVKALFSGSAKLAEEGGFIDHDRLRRLDNYFVTTALRFDPPTELFLFYLKA